MQSEVCHGSHLRALLSRMKMVDGDNAGEKGDDGGDGTWWVSVFFCVWRDYEKSGGT